MKLPYKVLALTALISTLSACSSNKAAHQSSIKAGDQLQALVNVHGDFARKRLYSLNYQLSDVIPVCSNITVDKVSSKQITITYQGQKLNYLWDGHTKKAGQSLIENFELYFGKSCDKEAINKLSATDKEGITEGKAKIGMSKQGVIFAMGYPPIHATPTLDNDYWLYWRNRFAKRGIQFSPDDKVSNIK